jgi:dipicolinate synthase subunit B
MDGGKEMELAGKRVGFALTGSFCTIGDVLPVMMQLRAEGAELTPIFSNSVYEWDTRFFTAKDLIERVYEICGMLPLHTVQAVEPIGPKKLLDIVVVAPCTGNTLAKMAAGVVDTPVLMACKSNLRNGSPVVLAVSTNDGLTSSLKNIGMLSNMRNIYLVPYEQDSPKGKPNSLVARMELIPDTCKLALEGKQIQPVLYKPGGMI